MQVTREELREKGERWVIPSLHAEAQSQSHHPSMFPVPKQWLCKWMWFLFHGTLILAAWCLCQTAEDYLRDFFFLFFIIMSDMVRTASGGCVTGVLASVHGRLTLTQWLNLGRGISGTTQTAAASYWKRAFMLIKVFLWLNRDFQGSLKRHI